MTRQTLVEGYKRAEAEGFVELGEGLSLQTFASIKQEDWFGTEMDNLDWSGCEDEDIFLMTDTGDAIKIDSISELLEEVEHENEPVKVYRVWADSEYDCFNEETYKTLEDAINEADWLWKHEHYKRIHVSSLEWLNEDGYPSDHNVEWENGDWTGEWVDEL